MEDYVISGTTIQEQIYRDILGHFKSRETFRSHHAVPVPNLHADVSSFRLPLSSRFPFRVYRPKPLSAPSVVSLARLKKGDQLIGVLEKTKEWEVELQRFLHFARISKTWGAQQKFPLHPGKVSASSEIKSVYTPHPYTEVVRHLEKQPIPNFCGDYNWLVTGGCTAHCSVGTQTVLLSPSGEQQDKLSVLCLQTKKKKWYPSKSQAPHILPLLEDSKIYQTVARSSSNNGLAAVRQIKRCSVVSIESNPENPLLASCILEIQDDKDIFTSVDLSPNQDNLCCSLNSSYVLNVWDLKSGSDCSRGHIPSGSNKMERFGSVKFLNDGNEILACNQNGVFIKDLRVPLKENVNEFSVSKIVNPCENVTYILPSPRSHLVYVATTHFLLNLDIRAGWLQRWTHFLQIPPVYGATQPFSDGSEELVLLSSYSPNNCTAFLNTYKGDKPQSFTFPACLPSVGDCLLWAQSQGECLGSSFCQRIKMCTAGLTLLPSESSDTLTSITSNSIGDNFSQLFMVDSSPSTCIKAYSSEKQDKIDLASWKEWEAAHQRMLFQNPVTLLCPAASRDQLFECGVNAAIDHKQFRLLKAWKKSFNIKESVLNKNPERPDWSQTMGELKTFKDLLAGVLLDPWSSQGLDGKELCENVDDSILHSSFSQEKKCTAQSFVSDSELDSASVLEMSLASSQSSRLTKKRKRDSMGF